MLFLNEFSFGHSKPFLWKEKNNFDVISLYFSNDEKLLNSNKEINSVI